MGAERLGTGYRWLSVEEFDRDVVTESGKEGGWLVIGRFRLQRRTPGNGTFTATLDAVFATTNAGHSEFRSGSRP